MWNLMAVSLLIFVAGADTIETMNESLFKLERLWSVMDAQHGSLGMPDGRPCKAIWRIKKTFFLTEMCTHASFYPKHF
jgi:hypothetical protein